MIIASPIYTSTEVSVCFPIDFVQKNTPQAFLENRADNFPKVFYLPLRIDFAYKSLYTTICFLWVFKALCGIFLGGPSLFFSSYPFHVKICIVNKGEALISQLSKCNESWKYFTFLFKSFNQNGEPCKIPEKSSVNLKGKESVQSLSFCGQVSGKYPSQMS